MHLQMKDVDVVAYTGNAGPQQPGEIGVPPGRVQAFPVPANLPSNCKIVGTWYSLADNISNHYILHHCEVQNDGKNKVDILLGSEAGMQPGRTRIKVHVLYEAN